MSEEIKHFEDLWNEAELIAQDDVINSTSSQILDELISKLSLYRAFEMNEKLISSYNLDELKEKCFGEILFAFTKLSSKDNINAYSALKNIIKNNL